MKKICLILLIAFIVLFTGSVFAASSPYFKQIHLTGDNYFQIRGLDKPHGYKDFSKFPGYDSYVHSNCYHVHGALKKIDKKTGREYYSKSYSIPLYCKGATKHIKEVFKGAKNILEISVPKFIKLGGLFALILTIPGDTRIKDKECNSKANMNSTFCKMD